MTPPPDAGSRAARYTPDAAPPCSLARTAGAPGRRGHRPVPGALAAPGAPLPVRWGWHGWGARGNPLGLRPPEKVLYNTSIRKCFGLHWGMSRRPIPIKVKSKDLSQIGELLRGG